MFFSSQQFSFLVMKYTPTVSYLLALATRYDIEADLDATLIVECSTFDGPWTVPALSSNVRLVVFVYKWTNFEWIGSVHPFFLDSLPSDTKGNIRVRQEWLGRWGVERPVATALTVYKYPLYYNIMPQTGEAALSEELATWREGVLLDNVDALVKTVLRDGDTVSFVHLFSWHQERFATMTPRHDELSWFFLKQRAQTFSPERKELLKRCETWIHMARTLLTWTDPESIKTASCAPVSSLVAVPRRKRKLRRRSKTSGNASSSNANTRFSIKPFVLDETVLDEPVKGVSDLDSVYCDIEKNDAWGTGVELLLLPPPKVYKDFYIHLNSENINIPFYNLWTIVP